MATKCDVGYFVVAVLFNIAIVVVASCEFVDNGAAFTAVAAVRLLIAAARFRGTHMFAEELAKEWSHDRETSTDQAYARFNGCPGQWFRCCPAGIGFVAQGVYGTPYADQARCTS